MRKSKDRKVFRRTATKTNVENLRKSTHNRGGIRR